MVTEGGIYLQAMVFKPADPGRIVFFGPLIDLFFAGSPMPHDQVAGNHHKSGSFLLHRTQDEPQCVLPAFLGILDVKVEKIRNADKAPDRGFLLRPHALNCAREQQHE